MNITLLRRSIPKSPAVFAIGLAIASDANAQLRPCVSGDTFCLAEVAHVMELAEQRKSGITFTSTVTGHRLPPPEIGVIQHGGSVSPRGSVSGISLEGLSPPDSESKDEKSEDGEKESEEGKQKCISTHEVKLEWCKTNAHDAYVEDLSSCRFFSLIPFGSIGDQCLAEQKATFDANMASCQRDFKHNVAVSCQ